MRIPLSPSVRVEITRRVRSHGFGGWTNRTSATLWDERTCLSFAHWKADGQPHLIGLVFWSVPPVGRRPDRLWAWSRDLRAESSQ